jgi:hypothetical protein
VTHAARLVGVALTALAVSGCAGGDTSLYVTNDTAEPWHLRVEREPDQEFATWVVTVDPGADTFALSWEGGESVPVEVLAMDCSTLGTFRPSESGLWVVDAVPGLAGRLERHGAPLGSRTTTPGVSDTEDCGGFLGR